MDKFAVGFMWYLTLACYLVLFLAVSSACCSVGYCLHRLCKIHCKKFTSSASDLESQTGTIRLTKVTVSIASKDSEEQTTSSQFMINNLAKNSETATTFSFKADINNTTIETENTVHTAKANASGHIVHASEIESDTIKERGSSLVYSEQQHSHGDTNFSEAETINFATTVEPNKQQLDIMATNSALADVQGIESSCSQTRRSKVDDVELKNVQFSHSHSKELTQCQDYGMCSSMPFPLEAESQLEMHASNDPAELEIRKETELQYLDKGNISEFSLEKKVRKEVEKLSKSKEEEDMADQKLLQVEVKPFLDQSACFPTDSVSAKRELVAFMQISSSITHDAHSQAASTPPTKLCQYTNVGASADIESSCTLPSSNTSSNSQTACKSFSNSCDIHDYEEIPDFQPKARVLQTHAEMGQPTAMDTDEDNYKLGDGVAHVLASLHSIPRGEDTDEIHPTAMDTDEDKLDEGVAHVLASLHSSFTIPRGKDTDEINPNAMDTDEDKLDDGVAHVLASLHSSFAIPRGEDTDGIHPTSMDTDEDKLDDGVAHVLASLHSSFAIPKGEDTDEIRPTKVKKKHALKGKLYELYRRKPSAQLKGLQNPTLAGTSSEEEGIDLLQKSENPQPVPSAQETVSGEQPCVDRFTFKYKLRKPIRRTKDLISKRKPVANNSNSQKVHPVCSAQVEMVTKRKQPLADISKSREGLQMYKILPPKDIQEPTLTSNKQDVNNEQKVTSSKLHGSSSVASRPAEIVKQNTNEIESIQESKADLDICLSSKENSPHHSKVSTHNQRDSELVPVKRKQVTIKKSESEEKIPVNYKMCGHDSDQLRKFSPSNNLHLHGTLPTKMKLTKEELRRQYRHRPPPPKNPLASPPARNKEDIVDIISLSDESEDLCHDQPDTISVVHNYEEIDLEEFPTKKKEASTATSKLKSKEELRKLYRHRVPPKIPTILTTDCKEDILTDVQHTEASEQDPHHDKHSGLISHRQQQSTSELEGITPPEKELCIQSSSTSTEIIPDTVKDKSAGFQHVRGEEDQPMSNAPRALESTAEGSSSHLLSASDSEDKYMPLIPKRKKKKANSDYEILHY